MRHSRSSRGPDQGGVTGILESIAAALVPPASAEHVLGDLAECSTSDRDYLRNLFSILPRVIWSQVRRRATLGGLVFHAVVSAVVLMATFAGSPDRLLDQPWVWRGLAAVWVVWILGCALSAAYGPADAPAKGNWGVFTAFLITAVATGALVGLPALRVTLALGILIGIILIVAMPWAARVPPPLSHATLHEHARLFQRRIWWRNAREATVGVGVLVVNVKALWHSPTQLDAAAKLLLIAGIVFIVGYLYFRAAPRAVPPDADSRALLDFHRAEIARQRDILRAVPWWYLMPFVPGLLVDAVDNWQTSGALVFVGMALVAALFYFVWRLNVWAAQWLDGELHKAEALEGEL
jgi:hypothetical protein